MKEQRRIREAVVLAAGNGRRMRSRSLLPKPLIEVEGRSLLQRIVEQLGEAGIDKVFIVVGYLGDEIRNHDFEADVEIEWVDNPDYHLANGISLLAVEKRVRSPFLLLMSDHLFDKTILEHMLNNGLPEKGGILAIDGKIQSVFDLPDATKVQSQDERVTRIGKDLTDFDSVDTGVFVLTRSVFPAMWKSVNRGDRSLTGGISELATRQLVKTWDIGPRRWIDIDTPDALSEAERLLRVGCLA